MPRFEYKVVPAPSRGIKAKGVKRAEDRFALALATVMNEHGAEGWDYIRADILPAEERSGLTSKQTVYHNMLIFRRELAEPIEDGTEDRVEAEDRLALAPPADMAEETGDQAMDEAAEEPGTAPEPEAAPEPETEDSPPLAAQ